MARYFDPSAAPTTVEDAEWALERSRGAIDGVTELLAANPPDRFEGG
jgi:hypothetical protein